MAINRTPGTVTNIKVYQSEAGLLAAATGDVSLTYVISQGVLIGANDPNAKYKIEIYTDANSVLHGLFIPK